MIAVRCGLDDCDVSRHAAGVVPQRVQAVESRFKEEACDTNGSETLTKTLAERRRGVVLHQ